MCSCPSCFSRPTGDRSPRQGARSKRSRLRYCVQNHKWLCSPPGSAFLYARRKVQHLIEPLVISWGWNRDERPPLPPGEGWGEGRFVDENEGQGTRDLAAYLSVPAAIQFQAEHEWPRVRAECHELLREARRRIVGAGLVPAQGDHKGRPYEPICPDSPEWYAKMAAFPLPPCDGVTLQRRLYEEYRVEVPIIEWNGRQFVRVSVQGYNTTEDVEAPAGVLREVLPQRLAARA